MSTTVCLPFDFPVSRDPSLSLRLQHLLFKSIVDDAIAIRYCKRELSLSDAHFCLPCIGTSILNRQTSLALIFLSVLVFRFAKLMHQRP